MIRKKKEWISQETKLALAETLLFTPAAIFWLSALVYVSMQTDYLFDVVVIPASKDWLGVALILMVITLLPGLGSIGAWLMWKKFENKVGQPLMVIGGIMAIAGVICAMVKF